jgi:NADH:ubiquinone oxidoreductase subunit 3 (subunit A)
MRIPLLNTILLLSSGVRVTWSHHEILKTNFDKAKKALMLTIFLGAVFTVFQGFEYIEAPFCMADSTFGSTFFIATGFHGLHVIIGSVFLVISLLRFNKLINSSDHIVGFECAAWYWHFVDVVWLFLYSMLYWWGAYSFSTKVRLISNKKDDKKIKISIIWILSLILLMIFLFLIQLTQKKITEQKEKWSQFECGFNLITPAHIPFSFQFFLVALLFLIFDIEIALVLSYPLEITTLKRASFIFLFLAVLSLGLIYEWQKGKINWAKWMGRISLQENQVCHPNH